MLQTVDEIYKVASISLSPNVPAQIFVSEHKIFHVLLFYVEVDTHPCFQNCLSDLENYCLFTDGANGQPSQTWRYFI